MFIKLPLFVKLSIFGFVWSLREDITEYFDKFIGYMPLSNWIIFTFIFILVHLIDVVYERVVKKENQY